MSDSVNIIGAGGHARPVIQLLQHLGCFIGGVYDQSYDPAVKERILQVEIKGAFPDKSDDQKLVLAIGDNDQRRMVFEIHRAAILKDSIVHPAALIEPSSQIGQANVIFARAYLSSMANIGDNNIINAGAIIEHESIIGSHCHVSVGAIVCGRVKIGDNCFILENQTIQPNVQIGNNVMIWSGNHLGHGTIISDHTYISSHVVISGNCVIGERCFFGVNSSVKDRINIKAKTTEKLGVIGKEKAIACEVITSVIKYG